MANTRAVTVVVERSPGGGGGRRVSVDGRRAFFFGDDTRALGLMAERLAGAGASAEELARVRWQVAKELRARRRVEVTAEVRR